MRVLLLVSICLVWFLAGISTADDYPWCSTMDDVFAEVQGDLLILHHQNATYNCCPESFSFTATVSNDSLYVTETENLPAPCDCMCCYKLSPTVAGLSPGEWQVVYRWLDDEPWGWRDWHLTVTIGGQDPLRSVHVVSSEASDCLEQSGTPGGAEFAVRGTWLLQNVPNPFNPQTTIAFDLPKQMTVDLRVYDVSGHLVEVLIDDEIAAQGRNEVVWRGRNLKGELAPAGVYVYRLEAGAHSETKRMVYLK